MTEASRASKWVTNHGVKIYPPKSNGYWRVVWNEDGKTRDTTAKNETEALNKAGEIERRLMTENGGLSMLSIKEMYEAYVDPIQGGNTREEWGKRHTRNTRQVFNSMILDQLGDIKCADLRGRYTRRKVPLEFSLSSSRLL